MLEVNLQNPTKKNNICYIVDIFHFNNVEASVLDSAIRTTNDDFLIAQLHCHEVLFRSREIRKKWRVIVSPRCI